VLAVLRGNPEYELENYIHEKLSAANWRRSFGLTRPFTLVSTNSLESDGTLPPLRVQQRGERTKKPAKRTRSKFELAEDRLKAQAAAKKAKTKSTYRSPPTCTVCECTGHYADSCDGNATGKDYEDDKSDEPDDEDDVCFVCGFLVSEEEHWADCKKCQKYAHGRCLAAAKRKYVLKSDYAFLVCTDCQKPLDKAEGAFPCSVCKRNAEIFSVQCDDCSGYTHMVCADMNSATVPDDVDFQCAGCAEGSVMPFTGCKRVSLTCYTSAAISMLQCLPKYLPFFRVHDLTKNIVACFDQKKLVLIGAVNDLIAAPVFLRSFRTKSGIEKLKRPYEKNSMCDASELFTDLIAKTDTPLFADTGYTSRDTTTCECGTSVVSNAILHDCTVFASAKDVTSLIQELGEETEIADYNCFQSSSRSSGKCEKTSAKATRRTTFLSSPEVLIVLVNRSLFGGEGKVTDEIADLGQDIQFDVQKLGGAETVTYRALGGTVHHGDTARTGHYTAVCRSLDANAWYGINDAAVSKKHQGIDASEASGVTMMLYERVESEK
jgi:hypothetical protein